MGRAFLQTGTNVLQRWYLCCGTSLQKVFLAKTAKTDKKNKPLGQQHRLLSPTGRLNEAQWQVSQPYQLAGPRGATDRRGHL
jgi:hypothetical protein